MGIKRADFENHIKNFRFRDLFNRLGWDNVVKSEQVVIDEQTYLLDAVAEKRDFLIFVCSPANGGKIPDSNTRKKIDRQITKLYFEHLIIFTNSDRKTQVWQLSIREPNKPVVTRETTYYVHQTPELLYQRLRGLLFTLDEEDKIALVDVKERVSESFNTNAERVTRQFYDKFKKEHRAFLGFIEGISKVVDREWYASLMLNRLMFIYFIQKKGFLDNDKNYLRNRLESIQEKKGKNKFYSFYRDFLLVLFHKGLGSPERDEALLREIGKVPYLNGGLFDVHHIEKNYENIQINDEAFEKIFDFFDQYEWHLDTRITATGRDINPDVIGYIFEKYINDRAAMGAYYTKEDITHYIAKNCIIPFLFQETKKECANAFREDSTLWKMLRDNPDRYIYDAVKHGVETGLPEGWRDLTFNEKVAAGVPDEIAVGIDTEQPNLLERRKNWNTSAPPQFALPTEIWREVIERRKRYWEIRGKIENGEIRDINDFITYNLDIQQFAQDAVEQYEGSDFINSIYKAITNITVLDPTCGSGAFLFAALNILEPLYEACIERMENFVREEDERGRQRQRFGNFRKVLEDIDRHPNRNYYIYKSIILNNLYGVDIMKEAVEIAKLRLFLKLVAEVDRIDHIEPLPDIDFNIRAGNTLVGFANYKELQNAIGSKLDFEGAAEKFREEAEKVGMAFRRFKNTQLIEDQGSKAFKEAKDELQKRLDELNEKLNLYLTTQYGIEPQRKPEEYKKWKASHQPFHWFAEFYEIVHEKGGFDAIIGNPPYVEYSKVRKEYTIQGYETENCGNLYAFTYERALKIGQSKIGLIIPIASMCTSGYLPLQDVLRRSGTLIISSFNDRPGKLFDGLEHIRLNVVLHTNNSTTNLVFGTKYNKWYTDTRQTLFPNLEYTNVSEFILKGTIPKISVSVERSILRKLLSQGRQLQDFVYPKGKYKIYYTRKLSCFVQILDFIPKIVVGTGENIEPSELKVIPFEDFKTRDTFLALLNSNIFYWLLTVYSDCRNLNKRDVYFAPLNVEDISDNLKNSLSELSNMLMEDLKRNSKFLEMNYEKYGRRKIQCIYPKYSKPVIDKIDYVLAAHYGLTQEELDFIINYDIKYRMGEELEED